MLAQLLIHVDLKRCLMRSKFYLSTCAFLVGACVAAADTKSTSDPWYFDINQVNKALSVTDGRGTVPIVVDTPVYFVSFLKGKQYAGAITHNAFKKVIYSESDIERDFPKKESGPLYKDYIHGTAIAGIISRIASGAKIFDIEWGTALLLKHDLAKQSLQEALEQSISSILSVRSTNSELTPLNAPSHPTEADKVSQKIFSINVSAGSRTSTSQIVDWLIRIAKDNHILIVAGVGNDIDDLNKDSKREKGLYPGYLKRPRNRNLPDPLLRVGATSQYSSKVLPDLYKG